MADFDAFESANQENQAPQEEDPAAAFLAREQTELAGLEDDNFGADSSVQQSQGDFDPFGGDQAPVTEVQQDQNADFFDDEGTAQEDTFGEPSEPMAGGDSLDDFEVVQPDSLPNVEESPKETNGPSDAYAAISQVDRLRQEPEKIKIWREQQQKLIQEKDAAEEERKNEWRDIARKELDDWYKHHEEQLSKTKENNREAEAAFVKDRDQTEPGEEWEKICRLCEFNPKNSKNTKDISRMRSILLQLKQTPLVR